MNIIKRPNSKGDKIVFSYDFGRGPRSATHNWHLIYKNPKDQTQNNHNKQALALLEIKKSQVTIEQQATGTVFIPQHKYKSNSLSIFRST